MTSILKLKTPSGGSISLQPTDTAALLTQSLPAESGTVLLIQNGATGSRPTVTSIGYMFFDITLGKPVWWNGAVWKDATGSTV